MRDSAERSRALRYFFARKSTDVDTVFPRVLSSATSDIMRYRLEFAPVWLIVRVLGALPRSLSRTLAIFLAHLFGAANRRLTRVGLRNLQIAFPEQTEAERRRILHGVFTSLGRQLAEFCRFPTYTKENAQAVAVYDGLEHYDAARQRGKGVLLMTAHLGGWELGSFFHSVMGNPIREVVRELDNPYLNSMVERYRTLYGNTTFPKGDFARGLLAAMRSGETVGVLMDTNMTPPQGVFVDYFGLPACTASGVARVALKTDAAVVPAFTVWDSGIRKYRVCFEPAVDLVRTGNDEADAIVNTAKFTKIIERYAREFPDQWLWVHRRWKTRPEGAPPVY